MSLHTEWIRYGASNQYTGYLAKPERASQPLPAVVVLQEIWGVDGHIQDVTRRFAQAGYVAFAPDLYSVGGERSQALAAERIESVKQFLNTVPPSAWHSAEDREAALARLPGDEGKKIGETFTTLFGGLNPDAYVPQLLETTQYLRNQCEGSKGQKIASVGYCMGGALSARLACEDGALAGAVIYYGNAPAVEKLKGVACPVRGFYGGKDPRITGAVPDFASAMNQVGKDFDYVVYEDAQHAFFNDTRAAYDPAASRDAFARTLTYFNTWLSR